MRGDDEDVEDVWGRKMIIVAYHVMVGTADVRGVGV